MRWETEEAARGQIKELIKEYYKQFHKRDNSFVPGERINYSGRTFDSEEMEKLSDAMLDFWLTAGRKKGWPIMSV